MNHHQPTIFDPTSHSLNQKISELLNCHDEPLLTAIALAVENFQALSQEGKYQIAFSGGKDSCVLLGIYCLYLKLGNQPLDMAVAFSDTELEHESLYQIVNLVKDFAIAKNIPFDIVKGKQSYWFVQFVLGYPVPNHFNRWCTGILKVRPMEVSKRVAVTGRHLGESSRRDQKLTCGTNDCGTDKIKKSYDPIVHFRNCLIWDALFFFDGSVLPEGIFNQLRDVYFQAQDTKAGSLRLGCFMCPVIAMTTIAKNLANGIIDQKGYEVRVLLEELRQARRLTSPKTGKAGAIYIEDRRTAWEKLDKEYLISKGWLTETDRNQIEQALQDNYSYPPTYKKEWIDREHLRMLGEMPAL